jgi:hypothetical protein
VLVLTLSQGQKLTVGDLRFDILEKLADSVLIAVVGIEQQLSVRLCRGMSIHIGQIGFRISDWQYGDRFRAEISAPRHIQIGHPREVVPAMTVVEGGV